MKTCDGCGFTETYIQAQGCCDKYVEDKLHGVLSTEYCPRIYEMTTKDFAKIRDEGCDAVSLLHRINNSISESKLL